MLFYKLFLLNSRTRNIINKFRLDNKIFYSWGMKKSGKYFLDNQEKIQMAFIEDGFIHSFGLKKKKIPLTICYDSNGIYYNSKSKSDLFGFLQKEFTKEDLIRAKNIIKLWKNNNISKYNFQNLIKPPSKPYILLIDQTYGDLSLKYGEANNKSFDWMFNFAFKNWPNHKIVIKAHPDVINSSKMGCLNKKYYSKRNVEVVSETGQINKLIEFSSAVCVVTSQVGFEALIYGKEVHVFGRPFYSGLGLTIDHKTSKNFKSIGNITIEKLVFAALVKYQICLDPRTNQKCDVENIMQLIKYKRDKAIIFPSKFYGINLTPWKARQINRFIYDATDRKVRPFQGYKSKMKNLIVWGKTSKLDKYTNKLKNTISVEDGFIRSVGLGGDLYPPLSLLFDTRGIHYDASKCSDLEVLLQNRIVKKSELERSKEIMNLLIKFRVTKYNLKSKNEVKLPKVPNKKIIAILGQVETDNSILYGVPYDSNLKTNLALVEHVRKDYPDAYLVYKPHPDIESGLRAKGKKESHIKEIVDFIAYQTSLEELLDKVDKVAVITSLGGFEALIRGISVTTYGLPFYAGWGLTLDKLKNHKWAKRRTRRLTIEELVFISLIEYPFYSSLKFNCISEIENVIQELISYNTNLNIEQIVFRYWGILKDHLLKLMDI